MTWTWQLDEWPNFVYDARALALKERQFLLGSGGVSAVLRVADDEERARFVIDSLAREGMKSSAIEGEPLEEQSLLAVLRRHFKLGPPKRRVSQRESGMAELLCHVYETFDHPLTHEMLCEWHRMLFNQDRFLETYGAYRTHPEPMQIVSNRYGSEHVYFEAPASADVPRQMQQYVDWFNAFSTEAVICRAAVAHVFFECIHPFEDGNGRIGRALVEKMLSQAVGQPTLIAVSYEIERRRKEYYHELGRCNKSLNIDDWVQFFADLVLDAQQHSIRCLRFLMAKSRMMQHLDGLINERQEKVLLRLFAAGIDGFQGGLSAENYISITKTSRATATRDLAHLVSLGVLRRTGQLRHTRYWLHLPDLEDASPQPFVLS